MRIYWIHYASNAPGDPPKYQIMSSDGGGYHRQISPRDGLSVPDEVVSLLTKRGADLSDAKRQVEAATLRGIANLLVK